MSARTSRIVVPFVMATFLALSVTLPAQSVSLTFNDPAPKKHHLTARASKLDPRARE